MDQAYLARFRERSEAEDHAHGATGQLPALPDLPLGRYTDPHFYALEREHLFGHASALRRARLRARGRGSLRAA